jgi:hypothetical protein
MTPSERARLRSRAAEIVAAAPPLTDEQRERITALLGAGRPEPLTPTTGRVA